MGCQLPDSHRDFRDAPLPIFVGEADTARMLLSIIGGAVATLLALIFTVIAVAIQLATGHYTPRALTILLDDKPTYFTIGDSRVRIKGERSVMARAALAALTLTGIGYVANRTDRILNDR